MKTLLLFTLVSFYPTLALANELPDTTHANIDIKAENIVSIAVGENTSSHIAIGVIDKPQNEATEIQIDIGSIVRFVFGENAEATIQLPQESTQ